MSYYEPLTYIVPPEDDGLYLKTVLQNRLLLSRKLLSRLKMTERGIIVNGERQYISVKVKSGDRVEVRMREETSEDILPQPIALDIIHEDGHLLIVNKPAGMIVHPTHGHYIGTLANGVVHHWLQNGEAVRFRPVHRLDRETSGVLAIAKNPYVHQNISEQMKRDEVLKEYLALVHGELDAEEGKVDAPIGRDPGQPHVRIVTPDGYPAVTHYRVERRFRGATLVRLRLETGRTHQIRVHMRSLGHPLLGDKMYGMPETVSGTGDRGTPPVSPGDLPGHRHSSPVLLPELPLERQALHAVRLGFRHPGTKQDVEYTAALPADMAEAVRMLQEWNRE